MSDVVELRERISRIVAEEAHGSIDRMREGHDAIRAFADRVATLLVDPMAINEMRLCEASFLVLHPDQLYRFTVASGCAACAADARHAPQPESTRPRDRDLADPDRAGDLRRSLRLLVTTALREDLEGGELVTKEAWEACEDDAERDVVRHELRRILQEVGHEVPSCPITETSCPRHGIPHGREAEDLRSGVEALIAEAGEPRDGYEALDLLCHLREALRSLLDRVDAADSLAHLEARAPSR